MPQGYSPARFPGDGPDQVPSWLVFNILIKSCFNLAKNEKNKAFFCENLIFSMH